MNNEYLCSTRIGIEYSSGLEGGDVVGLGRYKNCNYSVKQGGGERRKGWRFDMDTALRKMRTKKQEWLPAE